MSGVPGIRRASAIVQLTWVHAMNLGGDAIVTVSLAGTLFFTVPTKAARPHVLLYLLITMTPFAIVAPVVGPVIDRLRRWRRIIVATTCLGRATLCLLIAARPHSLLLYPEAFGILLLSKCYLVAKGAIVPAFVANQRELVGANAKLTRVALVSGAVAGLVAAGVFKLGGAPWTLWLAAAVYAGSAVLAVRLPPPRLGEVPGDSGPDAGARQVDREHPPPARGEPALRSLAHVSPGTRIAMAASSMGLLRGAVGFLTFLVVFVLKENKEPAWFYGVVIVASGVGSFIGAVLAPPARRRVSEEVVLIASMVVPAVGAVVDAVRYGRPGVWAVAFALGVGASAGRVAFDSLVQQYAPDAARGRAFARFETRFQLTWVIGAFLAVVLHLGLTPGLVILAAGLGVATFSYLSGLRAAALRSRRTDRSVPPGEPRPPGQDDADGLPAPGRQTN